MEVKSPLTLAFWQMLFFAIINYNFNGVGVGNIIMAALIVAYLSFFFSKKRRLLIIVNILFIPLIAFILTPLTLAYLKKQHSFLMDVPFISVIVTASIAAFFASFYIRALRKFYFNLLSNFLPLNAKK